MPFSNYADKAILDHVFGKSAFAEPTLYVALFTSIPGKLNTGTEVIGGVGYARVLTAASDWNVAIDGAGNIGSLSNANIIAFAIATGAQGTVTYFAIFDAFSGGHLIAYGQLVTPDIVLTGDTEKFMPGTLIVTQD